MPKLLRPRQDFPTPAFRGFVALVAALLGIAPGAILLGTSGWVLLPVAAALVAIPFVASRRRPFVAAAQAIVALLLVDTIAFVIAFVTYPWE
jgi:hypothetical protein